jgi:HD superfamily phosphohydrolase
VEKMPDEFTSKFLDKLQKIYSENVNLQQYWEYESAALRDILPLVRDGLAFNYEILDPFAVGGGGIVATCRDKNLGVIRALKLSRPSPGKEELLATILLQETDRLLRLSHQNLIKIYAKGIAEHANKKHPYYIMDYVEKVLDSDVYLKQAGRTEQEVLGVFLGVLNGIEYLHAQGTIHMDLKPGNVLVTPSGLAILSDLGFAKELKTGTGETLIGGTEGYIHPDARRFVQEAKTDPNRLRGKTKRSDLRPAWDLFSLGKTFLKLLSVLEDANPKGLSPYQKRYLKLLSCRLLDGQNVYEERAIGLSLETFKEIKYESVTQARVDLEKLVGSYNLEARVPELSIHLQDTIQVTTLAATPFTKRISTLLSHPAIMRLGSTTQLGLLNLVYPTATHTRLEHSLGTFSVLCRYIVALYNDALNPLFKQIMDESDLRAALISALVHDVGQYPLGHDLEEADGAGFSHVKLGLSILRDGQIGLGKLIADEWDLPVERVVSILQADPKEGRLRGTLKDRILHSLIDGPIDADKIDYLMRDSIQLGLTYGKVIDLERLLHVLTVVFRKGAGSGATYASLGIHEKGKIPAEAIAFARYAMYGVVYWHHAYRSIKALIHRMLWEALAAQKDDEGRTQFRKGFQAFVSPRSDTASCEQWLFSPDEGSLAQGAVSEIDRGDLAVLEWIAERGGLPAQQMLELLRNRHLFKRVRVLSPSRKEDLALWQELHSFRRDRHPTWKWMRELQQNFQQRIVSFVSNNATGTQQSAVITPDNRNKFIAEGGTKILLLLDIPPEKEGSNTELEYLREEDRRRYKLDEVDTGSLEESQVWAQLKNNAHQSIAKVRIFCHPDHSEFVSAYLDHDQMKSELNEVLAETIAEL